MENKKEYLNPDGLFKSSAFSQVVTTQGNGKNIYIGGQNPVNKNLEIIGKGDLSKQMELQQKSRQWVKVDQAATVCCVKSCSI